MQDPVRPLCHRELLEGGGGVLGVFDGWVSDVEEVDGSLGGCRPGLWRPSSPALATLGRRIGARGYFAGWRALGWAWCEEVLAPYRGQLPGVLGALVNLVFREDTSDGVGAVGLQGVALWIVRGAASLVQLLMAVPLHLILHPTLWAWVREAVLDCALTPEPSACVVVDERFLDSRGFLELWVRFLAGAVPVAGGRMMSMLRPGERGGPVRRTLGWSGRSRLVRGVRRLLTCRPLLSVRG